jgi:glucosamine 6-phosphate synthetase-like amidotransferase/phosphosugar isomerase protein
MCGLTGVILQTKRRRLAELDEIGRVFTELLLLNQARGKDAAGLAMIRRDGTYSLFKRPGPAAKLVMEDKYAEVMGRLDNATTCILGHTRWKTRGTEANSLNNMPLRAGNVIGAAAGTIINADELFRKFRLLRHAEVDSEFIFRLADASDRVDAFLSRLGGAQGSMSAILAKITRPDTMYVIKGNKPLTLWHHARFRALFYSSEEWPLEKVIGRSADVVPLDVAPFTLSVFRTDDLLDFRQHDMCFIPRNTRTYSWS